MVYLIYITRSMAKDAGLTHEGTLFGVPAWFGEEDGDIVMATPKVPLLHAWCWLADKFYDLLTYFTPVDQEVRSPTHINNPI